MVKGHRNRQLDNVVKSRHIPTGGIATADIADNAITNAKLGNTQEKTLVFEWERSAGANDTVATHALTGVGGGAPTPIPDNAVITNVTIEAITATTSGGSATIALGYTSQGAAFLAAIRENNAMWVADTVTSGGPIAVHGKTAQAEGVTMTIATAALTAGKFNVWVTYFESA